MFGAASFLGFSFAHFPPYIPIYNLASEEEMCIVVVYLHRLEMLAYSIPPP